MSLFNSGLDSDKRLQDSGFNPDSIGVLVEFFFFFRHSIRMHDRTTNRRISDKTLNGLARRVTPVTGVFVICRRSGVIVPTEGGRESDRRTVVFAKRFSKTIRKSSRTRPSGSANALAITLPTKRPTDIPIN